MKRVIAWILLVTLCLGLFAGCKNNDETPSTTVTPGDNTTSQADLEAALEYVKTVYRKPSEKTPKDFKRIGVVPVNGKEYEIVWTADVGEEYIKVVKGDDGMVTIDVNEAVEADVKYVLTATVSDGAGNSVSHSWNHILPAPNNDMVAIVEEAYALESGASMDYEVTLTGIISTINTPWSDDYKNITVTIKVAGAEDKPIQCYRLTGEGAKDLKIGDTITVTGTLKNYNGTIEFDAGCTLDEVIAGETVDAPSDMKQIVNEAYALGANESLPYEATLTGTITAVGTPYDSNYKNVTVTIVVDGCESKPIVCYRLKGDGADKIGVNDVITVKGYITNYVGEKGNSTIEFTAGCQLLKWEDKEAPVAPTDFKAIVDAAYALGANESLKYEATLTGKITKVGTAYDSNYGNITVTMVVEGRESKPIVCYRMKGDGVEKIGIGDIITVKGYITNYVGEEGYSTIEFNYPALVSYTKNTTVAPTDPLTIVNQAYALKVGEQLPYEATLTGKITEVNTAYDVAYKNVTVTIVVAGAEDKPIKCYRLKGDGADKIGVDDIITVKGFIEMFQHESGDAEVEYTAGCVLVKWENTGADAPVVEAGKITIAEAIAKGAAMEHNTYTTEKYQITGTISEVYNSVYGNMYVTDGNGNTLTIYGTYDKDGNRYDAMTTKPVAGDIVTIEGVIGQYNDVAQMKNGVIVAHTASGVTPPPKPEAPKLPDTDGAEVSIADAIAAGSAMEHNTYTELKYKVTGEITEVYNTTYGNMKIKDAEGNVLTVYGTYDATGENRYDAMEVKPVAGDTVTVYGVIGQYNGTAQLKNGWIVAHTPADTEPEPEPKPEVPALPDTDGAEVSIADAIAAGSAMEHNTYTELKYKVTGEITEVYNTTYGNMKIKDADGNILTVYGTYDATGENRYDAMEVKPVAGDTVTVYGVIGQYNGTAQLKNGWIVAHTIPAPALPDTDGAEVSIADAIAAGSAMEHNTYTELKYKVTGEITEVYNTTYGNMKIKDADGNILTVYGTYDATGENRYDAMEVKPVAGDTVTVYGVIGQYNGTAQLKNGWIVAHTPADTEPEPEPEPEIPVLSIPAANELGAAQTDSYTEQKYQVAGTITEIKSTTYGNMYIQDAAGNTLYIYGLYDAEGNRYDAMAVKPEVGDVLVVVGSLGQYKGAPQMKNATVIDHKQVLSIEAANALGAGLTADTEGKYLVSGTVTEIKNTTYGNLYIQDDTGATLYIYGAYSADGSVRYDAMEQKPAVGDYICVYGVMSQYKGSPQMKNGWVVEHRVAATLPDANTIGAAVADKETTAIKYQVTGTVTEIKNTTYGNLYIQDAEGNQLYIYGLYDAIGNLRYDAMTVKPAVGDTVTVYGVLCQYKGTAQMKNGWLLELTPAQEAEPEAPAEITKTMSFADLSNRTSFSETQQVWEQNGITFINDKASYNNNLGDYYNPVRIYAGTSVTFECDGMIKIAVKCNSKKPVSGLTDSLTNIPGITVTVEGDVVVIEFLIAIDSFTIPAIAAQVRFDEVTIYVTETTADNGGSTGSEGEGEGDDSTVPTPSDPITDVVYTYGESSAYSNVIKNWGRREFDATFLSPNALTFYETNEVSYDQLAALAGTNNTEEVPVSELYAALQSLMTTNHTTQTTYGDTRYLYCFTDCQDQDNLAGISAFYSGNIVGPSWDSGDTWNREHCWPKSKTTAGKVNNGTSGECGDLMTLRPVESSSNSSRGNKAYGVSEGFYDPNAASGGAYDLRGDVARIVLYTYVRWGNTSYMWGADGVIESADVLLDWIEADPVDTWEMGRNDSVESVTGTRNVFVDYPELAFVLFGEEVPSMTTPSGKAAA